MQTIVLVSLANDKLIRVQTVGKTANCCLVMAQLITKGENHGMHFFFVQIRDLNTHEPLPGMPSKKLIVLSNLQLQIKLLQLYDKRSCMEDIFIVV